MTDAAGGSPSPRPRLDERVAELLDDARAAEAAGDWRLRRALLTAVTALDPTNEDVARLLAEPAARRQMTLLFCDVVGSTELADARDPEEVTELLTVYRRTCEDVVAVHEGHVDDHRGDGMLVLFGFPQVHEDDARRAVSCGLEIIERLRSAFTEIDPPLPSGLRVRIAVHTDLVVIGEAGITGATANEASRIQQLAAPDTVVISDTTRQLVEPLFEMESLGVHRLRGVSRPVELFSIQGERRLGEAGPRPSGSPPFVGREPELARIVDVGLGALGSSTPVEGGVLAAKAALVRGAPGIGKTRLVREAAGRLGARLAMASCSRLHQNATLHAFRPMLAAALGIGAEDDAASRRDKLRSAATSFGDAGDRDLPFLASVFDVPLDQLDPPADVDPSALRERGLRRAVDLLRPQGTPTIMFVDDVHWADQATLDVLSLLLQSTCDGLFVVMTSRESFTPPGPVGPATVVTLGPLAASETLALATRILREAELAPEERAALVERSDGVPLFLEELIRTELAGGGVVAHRAQRYGSHRIPPALRDPLLARLLVPGVDVELAQVAAVGGREIDRERLRRAVDVDSAEFDRRLGTLVVAGIVEQDTRMVRFRHELIREVAYDTQRRSVAEGRHSWFADHLSSLPGDVTREVSEEIAFHLERAHRVDEAIGTHLRIAEADLAVGSHVQASQRLTRVLGLLQQVADEPRRLAYELTVRGLRSFSVVMAHGYAAPDAAEDHARCVELCQVLRPAPDVVPFLIRSWSYYALRGDLAEADRVSATASSLVARAGSRFAGRAMGDGVILFFRGRFEDAREQLERFVVDEWASPPDQVPDGWPLPNDPLAAAYAHLAPILQIAGDSTAAQEAAALGRARAATLPFPYGPFSELYVGSLQAMTLNLAGDHAAATGIGHQMTTQAERHGFGIWQMAGLLALLTNRAQSGDAACCDQLVDAVALSRNVLGADAWTPYWLTGLGRAQQHLGRLAESKSTYGAALEVADRTGACYFSSEALRGRGEVRLAMGDAQGVGDLESALELAERQRAPLFVRRAQSALTQSAR